MPPQLLQLEKESTSDKTNTGKPEDIETKPEVSESKPARLESHSENSNGLHAMSEDSLGHDTPAPVQDITPATVLAESKNESTYKAASTSTSVPRNNPEAATNEAT